MTTRAALSASTLDEEVQRRLDLFANKPSTSKCNGINHTKTILNTPTILNEGTEFPDQLTNRLGPETVLKDLNKPNTSSTNIIAEDGGSVDSKTKKTAEKLLDSERKNGKRKKFRSSRGPSNDNPSCSSSSERRSLRQLQEMALTSFCRDKWINGKYKIINVELNRDSKIGLGITVAGYVYRKEEISGVFIKSLVPQSSAHLSKQIQLHDLIVEVNGRSLEGLSHNDSVRVLINSGNNVNMKLVRFDTETPQSKCLKMLHEQELFAAASAVSAHSESSSTATGRTTTFSGVGGISSPLPEALCEHHKKHSLVDYKSFWSNKFGSDYDIIVVDLQSDNKIEIDGGIGIEWQGTVDICNGNQLCSHHFIESLRKNGPAEKTGILKAGDELLQVNDISLYGESFIKMRKVLNCERKENSPFIRLIFCRKTELDFINFVIPSPEQCLPIAYPLLASMMAGEEHFIKAKSEIGLFDLNRKINEKLTSTPNKSLIRHSFKSRSLENLSGLAVWNCVPLVVPLLKDNKGLGFSIADYQDPLHPERVVLIIRSLVPGGAAQADGRIVPGDRLLFVNDKDLSNSSLENAVEVLKTAPIGQIVRLGIAKPVPIEKCRLSTSPLISQSERFQAKSHSPRGRRRHENLHLLNTTDQCFLSAGSSQEEIWIGQHNSLYNSQRCLNPQLYFPSPSSASTPKSITKSPMQTATVSAWTPCSSRSLSPCASPAASLRGSWSYDILFLPSHLERHIKILKSSLPLGVTLDADVDKAINGCVVKNICSKKALAKDGRIQTGDFIVKINGENLRNVTNAQARAIMKRANLIGAHCNISYITSSDARLWKDRFHRLDSVTMFPTNDNIQQIRSEQNVFESSRLSPKVYPKFYKSPLFNEDLLLLATTTNALNFSIGSSELQSPNNVDEHFLPSTSEILENKEESRKEEISQLNQINFEKFVDNLQKAIITDAIFDLYILWRRDKQSILHSNIAPSLSSQFSTSPKTLRSPRAVRASSIALTQPPPKPEKGILRRAASSFKKKRSKPIEEQNTGYVTSATTTPNIGMNSRSRQNSDTLEISEMNVTTTSSLPTSPKCDEFRESTNREPMNFWSEPRSVILQRNPNETFGISIVGGRVEVSQKGIEMATFGGSPSLSSTVSGIFIKSVVADSPAGRCGKLFMGDRLLKVNDIDLLNTTHENAVQAIKNAENPVCFVVQSLQSLQTFVAREGNSKKDSLTSIISEGQTSIPPSPAIVEIDTESAAALEKDEEDNEIEDTFHYTKRKVLMKYSDLPGKPVLIRMPNIPPGGLGLILSTRRDEGASRPPVIVVGVKSDSPLSLKVGDELLEINGRVLFGLSHQNATEKIRKCCQHSSLSLLVLRNVQESQSSSTQQSEQEEIKNTTENIINKNNNDLKTNDEIEVLTEKENTSESECEAGARTIVSEILSRQQKTPEVKIEPPEDAPSAIDGLKPETTQNDSVNSTNEPISRKRSWQMEQQQSQFLQKCPIQIGQETLIEIDKDGKGLGLSIVGGSDTVLGTVIIHEVYPDGAAAIDGRLKPGDQVFEVNNTSLRNSTHEQAILLLRRTPTKVRLLVYRDQNLQMSLLDPTQIYNIIDIELLKKAGKGLGISIVGRKNEPGVYVSEIVKGGVADTDGRLMQGDQILSVNNHDVANWMQEDVATVLKTCIGKVSLKIGRWKLTETAQRVRSAQPPPNNSDNSHNTENNINSIEETQMPLQQQQNINEIQSNLFSQEKQPNGTKDPPPPAPFPPGGNKLPPPTLQITLHDENNQQANLMGRTDLSPVSEEDLKSIAETVASEETISGITTTSSSQRRPISQLQNSQSAASTSSFIQPSAAFRSDLKEAGCDSLLITLKKDEGQQWGMGIGKRPRGILITSLQPGSSAAEKLAIGDRIMAVNAHEVTTQHSAVTYIRSSGNSVTLQISRPAKLSTTTTTSNN